VKSFLLFFQRLLNHTRCLDFIPLLALRIYLAFVFFMPGLMKLKNITATAQFFGSMHFPLPTLMAYLAGMAETVGAVLLLIGLLTRWMTIPLMIVMLVAIFAVHWDNGWSAIAAHHSDASVRINHLLSWLKQHFPGRYEYVTEFGQVSTINNGIEFAVTYLIMLSVLFFQGAGKYFSIDYWVSRWLHR